MLHRLLKKTPTHTWRKKRKTFPLLPYSICMQLGSHPQKSQRTAKRAMMCAPFLFVLSYSKTCMTKVTHTHSPQAITAFSWSHGDFIPVIPVGKSRPSSFGHHSRTALPSVPTSPHQLPPQESPHTLPQQFTCSLVLGSSQNWPHHLVAYIYCISGFKKSSSLAPSNSSSNLKSKQEGASSSSSISPVPAGLFLCAPAARRSIYSLLRSTPVEKSCLILCTSFFYITCCFTSCT